MANFLSQINWADINLDHVLEHSYKDFHAKGLDYICLARTPELTLKAYFFAEGMESQKLGEVVNPHDHRYDFDTMCLSGKIRNKWYQSWPFLYGQDPSEEGWRRYECFEYRTPLNGGDGFAWDSEVYLKEVRHRDCAPGERYFMEDFELHTIQVMAPETCIVLMQFEDTLPLDQPTFTFTQSVEPPSLKGLYSEFTADEALNRIQLLKDLSEKV